MHSPVGQLKNKKNRAKQGCLILSIDGSKLLFLFIYMDGCFWA